MAKITLGDVANLLGNPTSAANTLNTNNTAIEQAFENTLSRDGSTPNQMESDLDMNNHDILNAKVVSTDGLIVDGQVVLPGQELNVLPDVVMLKTDYDPLNYGTAPMYPAVYDVNGLNSVIFQRLPVMPEAFGALYNGSDDAVAITQAMAFAVANKRPLVFTAGRVYTFSQLVFPAGIVVKGIGSTLRCIGTLSVAGDRDIVLGAGCLIDELNTTRPATGTNGYWMEIGVGCKIGKLTQKADAQWAMNGVITTGQDVYIGRYEAEKVERAFDAINTNTAVPTTGLVIESFNAKSWRRGFYAEAVYGFVIREGRVEGRSPNVLTKLPGMNGFLIAGCSNFDLGDWYIEGAGEHAGRVGGSPDANVITDNFRIGDLEAVNCWGSALKLNPTRLASVGVTEKCRRWRVGTVIGIDIGEGTPDANSCLLRLTHAYQGYIKGAYAFTRNQTVSGQFGLLLNDCDDIQIDTLGGDNFTSGFIYIDGTSDADGILYFGGDVTNIRIGKLVGATVGNNAIGVNTSFNIGEFNVMNADIAGWSTFLVRWDAGTQIANRSFNITGNVYGSVAPAVHSGTPTLLTDINVKWNKGWAALTAFNETTLGHGFHNINNSGLPAGIGNYGGGMIMTRLGSGRRGAAVVGRQYGTNAQNFGLEFLVSTSTVASDTLLEALRLNHELALQIRDGITTPATVSGWASLYVDSVDGDLKVRFGDGTIKTIVVDT